MQASPNTIIGIIVQIAFIRFKTYANTRSKQTRIRDKIRAIDPNEDKTFNLYSVQLYQFLKAHASGRKVAKLDRDRNIFIEFIY
jgi:hypothetical protein